MSATLKPVQNGHPKVCWIAAVLLVSIVAFAGESIPIAQQEPELEPHTVYSNLFLPCSADRPCSRTENFTLNAVPQGCCTLTVTNGDGNGNDETSMYEVILNGARVVPVHRRGNAQAQIHLLRQNTLKVNLTGRTLSKLRVRIDTVPQPK